MMPSTSVAPTPINTFFQVFIAKVSRLTAYNGSRRVLAIERRQRTVVAHEQLRSDERESSLVRAKRGSPCVTPVGLRRKTRGAIDYIVARVRLVGPQIDHCCSRLFDIRPEARLAVRPQDADS